MPYTPFVGMLPLRLASLATAIVLAGTPALHAACELVCAAGDTHRMHHALSTKAAGADTRQSEPGGVSASLALASGIGHHHGARPSTDTAPPRDHRRVVAHDRSCCPDSVAAPVTSVVAVRADVQALVATTGPVSAPSHPGLPARMPTQHQPPHLRLVSPPQALFVLRV